MNVKMEDVVSHLCAWERYFGCTCEVAGASPPPPLNILFPSCGESSFAERKEMERAPITVRDR